MTDHTELYAVLPDTAVNNTPKSVIEENCENSQFVQWCD